MKKMIGVMAWVALAMASMAIHLPMSMPKGGNIMVKMPMAVMMAVRGMTLYRPRMSSMSREPMRCSMAPTHMNNRPLDTEW